jgi:hypothetical protein
MQMLLLDKNKEPVNTVYYLAALIDGLLRSKEGLDYSELLKVARDNVTSDIKLLFFNLALDFLYLTGRITVDGRGKIYAHSLP